MTVPAIIVINTKAVIDGTGAKPFENVTVVVEGSTIKTVRRQDQTLIPKGPHVRVLNFPNSYLLPGLVDVHIHLMLGD